MNSPLGRINIFTLATEAGKAVAEFIQSLPLNEDGDETIAVEIEHQLKSTIEDAINVSYLQLIDDKLPDPEELQAYRILFGFFCVGAFASR